MLAAVDERRQYPFTLQIIELGIQEKGEGKGNGAKGLIDDRSLRYCLFRGIEQYTSC